MYDLSDLQELSSDDECWGDLMNVLATVPMLKKKLKIWKAQFGVQAMQVEDRLESLLAHDVYNAFKGVDVSTTGALVSPPDGLHWFCSDLRSSSMFIRSCYKEFWNFAVEVKNLSGDDGGAGCLFIGNPGIGKSCWLNYTLIRLLQEDKTVLLERTQHGDRWLFKDGRCYQAKQERDLIQLMDVIERDAGAFYLFDPDKEGSDEPKPVDAFTIIASSPNNKHYKVFVKSKMITTKGHYKRYFPCWALEELQRCNLLDVAAAQDRFEVWGGIPRYVFAEDQEELKEHLHRHVTSVDLGLIERYRGTLEISQQDQDKLSHMLVQYRVESPYLKGELDFASPFIGDLIIKQKLESDHQALITHYQKCLRQQWQGVYAGHLWEHLCHYLLPASNGGAGLRIEPLEPGAVNGKIILKLIAALDVGRGRLDDMAPAISNGKYFQPSASNFPVIDSALKEGNAVYGFQITLAKRHPPSGKELVKILKQLGTGLKFYLIWVVDPAKAGSLLSKQTVDLTNVAVADRHLVETMVTQWKLELRFPKEAGFLGGMGN